MTHTNERLADEALIAEAERLAEAEFPLMGGKDWLELHELRKKARDAHIIRLAREGWQPPEPEPVDPVIIGVREILAAYYTAGNFQLYNKEVEQGIHDNGVMFQAASKVLSRLLSEAREEGARGREGAVPEDACPFCGGEADFIVGADKVHPYRAVCKTCGAATAHHGSFPACIAAWKRRPSLPSTPATPKPESTNVKPDRYLKIWQEAEKASLYARELNHNSDQAAAAVLKREIEALRGVSPIPKAVVDLVEEHERIFERQRLRQNIGDGSNWHKTYVAPAIEALREGDVR